MQAPIHPFIIHLPLALSFILPPLIFFFLYLSKYKNINYNLWPMIISFQVMTTLVGYVAMETGENEEAIVKSIVAKKVISAHEEKAEIFIGSTVIILVLSIGAYLIKKEFQFKWQLVIGLLSFVSLYLAVRTGQSGGELVYQYGAANAYASQIESNGLLPTPGQNTSESPMPTDEENESLKTDENDYGNADEEVNNDDGDLDQGLKQED